MEQEKVDVGKVEFRVEFQVEFQVEFLYLTVPTTPAVQTGAQRISIAERPVPLEANIAC